MSASGVYGTTRSLLFEDKRLEAPRRPTCRTVRQGGMLQFADNMRRFGACPEPSWITGSHVVGMLLARDDAAARGPVCHGSVVR
jgi:hypothetical protein